MTERQLAEIGEAAAYEAATIFARCGAGDDFCHQTGLVFGGTNRIKLTPLGWVADESYCTERFLRQFKALHPLHKELAATKAQLKDWEEAEGNEQCPHCGRYTIHV